MFEITLLKHFFGLKNDIRIIFTYASPINSCYTKYRTDNILDKIETNLISMDNNYLIMGDLNGRTRLGDDFVRDSTDKYTPINNSVYSKDENINRMNFDNKPIDEQGKKILDLCKSVSCRILNDRTPSDRI